MPTAIPGRPTSRSPPGEASPAATGHAPGLGLRRHLARRSPGRGGAREPPGGQGRLGAVSRQRGAGRAFTSLTCDRVARPAAAAAAAA